jgi:hypothetical protein
MAIREILEKIMAEYPSVSKQAFKENPFIQYAKTEIPKSINASLDLPEFYSVSVLSPARNNGLRLNCTTIGA